MGGTVNYFVLWGCVDIFHPLSSDGVVDSPIPPSNGTDRSFQTAQTSRSEAIALSLCSCLCILMVYVLCVGVWSCLSVGGSSVFGYIRKGHYKVRESRDSEHMLLEIDDRV